MSNPTGKTKHRKTTIVLSVTLVLLVVFALTVFLNLPAFEHYYVTHVQYPVYGGMTADLKDCELYKDMQSGKSFCFLGDSITAGNEIGGIPWYQPLVPDIKGDVSNISCGGWMVHHLLEHSDEIPAAEVYVVAIGVNDIVRPDLNIASASPEEYTGKISTLTESLHHISPDAKIYLIAPWALTKNAKPHEERAEQFRKALMEWCSQNGCTGIDPNTDIYSVLSTEGEEEYMKDSLHPNTPKGVGLYSYAVLKADHERKAA